MWIEKHKSISLILTILLAVEIFWFSSLQLGGVATGGITFTSIIYHFSVFFLFNFFLISTIKGNKEIKIKSIIIILTISLAYAISDELHQMFVPLRSSSLEDVLIDSIGIFSSMLIYLFIERKTNSQENL